MPSASASVTSPELGAMKNSTGTPLRQWRKATCAAKSGQIGWGDPIDYFGRPKVATDELGWPVADAGHMFWSNQDPAKMGGTYLLKFVGKAKDALVMPGASAQTACERAEHMRDLLDARSAALAEHGLDMRTELRPGDTAEQLQLELAAYDQSMLVLGTSNPAAIRWDWLRSLLEESPQRAVLIVNSARAESAVDG